MNKAIKKIVLYILLMFSWLISPITRLLDRIIWIPTMWDNDGVIMKLNRFNGHLYHRQEINHDENRYIKMDLRHDKYRDKSKLYGDNPYKYSQTKGWKNKIYEWKRKGYIITGMILGLIMIIFSEIINCLKAVFAGRDTNE